MDPQNTNPEPTPQITPPSQPIMQPPSGPPSGATASDATAQDPSQTIPQPAAMKHEKVLTPSPAMVAEYAPPTPPPTVPSPAPEPPAPAPEVPASPYTSLTSTSTPPTPPEPEEAPTPGPPEPPPQVITSSFEALAPTGPVVTTAAPSPEPLAPPPSSKKGRWKAALIGLAGVLVLGGGSAAAYYGVVVPNQPQHVLETAVLNSLQQKQVNYTATDSGSPTNSLGGFPAFQASVKGSGDSVNKVADATFNVTVSGVNFNLEARYVDQNLYFRAGDLSNVAGLVGGLDPSLSGVASTLSKQLSNQWIEVDSTLLNEGTNSCMSNINLSLNQADVKLLQMLYAKNPFVTINSTSSATVAGQAAEKFNITINDDKADSFATGLSGLSVIKALQACEPSSSSSSLNTSKFKPQGDNQQTPLTVWVSQSSKQVVQLAIQDTPQQIAKIHEKVSAQITLNYNKVSVTAPSGAEPFEQAALQVEQTLTSSGINVSNLFSGLSTSSTSSSSSTNGSVLQ